MNETQRAAALRLADDEFATSGEAAALLRELAADPVVNQSLTTDPRGEPVAWVYEHDGMIYGDSNQPIITTARWPSPVKEPYTETPLYAAPQQPIRSADIETKDEQHDLHRRSVEIMSAALAYSERMTVAMERIASVATDWRGNAHGITGEPL